MSAWRRLVWVLLALVLAGLVSALVYRDLALPVTDGSLRAEGLGAPVKIVRDARGIPTITAASPHDAWFALGFVHAQDRLWQLDLHRRIGSGRLAEAFGASALEADRFLRALGVRHRAETQWQRAAPEVRAMLEAYTAGINAHLADHLRARPPEFWLLGVEPERWSPVDSIAWSTMMAWDLGGNWSSELLRMRLAQAMPTARIGELLPPYPGDEPLQTRDFARLYSLLAVADVPPAAAPARTAGAALPWEIESGVEGVGSNNWVVAGSRSVSGRPLLANDPHLKLNAPSLWYVARIEAPGLKVAGATMPGLPLVVLGQNEHIAWGFTNTGPDVQDVYLERLDTRDPSRYETPDGWAAFESREETIRVRGQGDVRFTARSSRHGPVISDANTSSTAGLTGRQGADGAPRYALALSWTALDADASDTLAAGHDFNRATSVEEFIAAAARYVAPMQNMVVADSERVAMVSAGRVPVRGAENDLKGLAPAPGWDARYDWTGTLSPSQTPRDLDAARGWIATANQRIHSLQYPHFITSEWTLPYRQQRIEQLLAARTLHSLDTLAAIQADVVSGATLRLLPHLQSARSSHPLAAAALRRLQGFDGNMAAAGAAPLIFSAWVRYLTEDVFADDLGADLYNRQAGNRSFRDALERVMDRDEGTWCDDITTPPTETCATQSDRAFDRALVELQALQGDDVTQWQWGRAHAARAEHRPFSRVKALAGWFELRAPVGGDAFTVNAARASLRPDPTTGEPYLSDHGAGLRALYDLNDPQRSRFMYAGGQSGLPFSTHHGDLMAPWSRAEYLPLWSSPEASREAPTLVLEPR